MSCMSRFASKCYKVSDFSASTSVMLARPAKFPSVTSITLYFPASQGADTTRIYYVGFLGVWSEVRHSAELVYALASPELCCLDSSNSATTNRS